MEMDEITERYKQALKDAETPRCRFCNEIIRLESEKKVENDNDKWWLSIAYRFGCPSCNTYSDYHSTAFDAISDYVLKYREEIEVLYFDPVTMTGECKCGHRISLIQAYCPYCGAKIKRRK